MSFGNELRRSQLITSFSVGAITELKQFTGLQKSPNTWDTNLIDSLKKYERINDERLASALGVDYFLQPPKKNQIPFTVFPKYLHCPKCHELKYLKDWIEYCKLKSMDVWYENNNRRTLNIFKVRCYCNNTKYGTRLIPSRFITVCPHGHLDDFPYNEWVHYYEKCNKQEDGKAIKLKLTSQGGGVSLSDLYIECTHCRKKRNMAGALSSDNHKKYSCSGNLPERAEGYNRYEENCDVESNQIKFVLRSASNVHFPRIISSLLIPPFATELVEKIVSHEDFLNLRIEYRKSPENISESLSAFTHFRYKEFGFSTKEDMINKVIEILKRPNQKEKITSEEYKHQEYSAFLMNEKAENFIVRRAKAESINEFHIDSLIECSRLSETLVFTGFTRVYPNSISEISVELSEQDKQNNNVKLIRAATQKLGWLPGIKQFGEGIFISFNNDKMLELESYVSSRVKKINNNVRVFNQESGFNMRIVNGRFVALHTLSHLLIKRIAFDSGFNLASLKEKIYCNIESEFSMNAILIYTVDSDIEGTLGGLARLASENKIRSLIEGALIDSEWCSSDPVCRESSGQGMGSLNLAACHSCCLLPETCCEYGNRYLDRETMESFWKIDER
jgi:hypothetical protein